MSLQGPQAFWAPVGKAKAEALWAQPLGWKVLPSCHAAPVPWPSRGRGRCRLVGASAMVPKATRWQIWLMNPKQ